MAAEGLLTPIKSTDWAKRPGTRDGLHSAWEDFYYPHETAAQGHWQGEIDELVVYGTIPKEIDGTFYRIIIDPYMPPDPRNGFVEGDGNVCAVRIQDGKASLKMRYVETERLLLERQAGRRLFGVYRNPYTNDPSTQFANDSTGNTNIIYWGGHVLALAERGLPWAIDPDTLETRRYDPYAGQVQAKTFTAHPKVDPKSNELVTWSQEAKGLGTTDMATYAVTAEGKVKDIGWYSMPDQIRWIHDGWITDNWIVLSAMPFDYTGEEALKAGAQHWQLDPQAPQTFIVVPRRPSAPRHPDWKVGEFRRYTFDHGLIVHTGSAWEDENGHLKLESPWTQFNGFYFWGAPDHKPSEIAGQYVRWTIDPSQPTDTRVTNMEPLLSMFNEFPAVDDRFNTTQQHTTFLVAADLSAGQPSAGNFSMNTIVKLDTKGGKAFLWGAGNGGKVSEPTFIPRSQDAPEGDGWVLFATSRTDAPRGEMIILDTNDFSKPVAVIQMPFVLRDQLHGNWVPNPNPGTKLPSLTRPIKFVQPTGVGALNYI